MKLKVYILAILTAVFACSAAYAANCPQVDNLPGIAMSHQSPFNIAADKAGRLYVTDYINGTFSVLDRLGNRINSISVKGPLGVAVDGAGRVYLGRAEGNQNQSAFTGEVDVYDSGLNLLYKLGGGAGEFQYPVSVAVDAARVYVADSNGNTIKIYDINTHQLISSFGGIGSAPGTITSPAAVVVNPLTGNLIVLDRGLFWDAANTTWALGARVQEFTPAGQFVRTYGTYGFDMTAGVIGDPEGLAVDTQGRIAVADTAKNIIHFFAPDGTPLCFIQETAPRGLLALADGRLLASTVGGIAVLGLDDYVTMSVTPLNLDFNAQKCGGGPQGQVVTITNTGKGTLNWNAASDSPWLTAGATSGQLTASQSTTIPVSASDSALAPGDYTGNLSVSYQGGTDNVVAKLNVQDMPVLSVSPQTLSFAAKGSVNPPAQSVNVSLTGDSTGSMTWSASSNAAWLGVSPSIGPSDVAGSMNVSVNIQGLDSGHYTGTITVNACSKSGPQTVAVSLDYVKGGTINVVTNNGSASFSITGPQAFTGTGAGATFAGVPDGTYTITFGHVQGFRTPASFSLAVNTGQTVQFTGAYIDLRKKDDIATSPSSPVKNAFENIFSGDGTPLGSFLLSPAYRVESAASGDVDGDGKDEIILSVSTHGQHGVVLGFKADGTPMPGINFMPFRNSSVNLAVADVDGDGKAEIIASSSGGASGASVRVFKYSGSAVTDTGIYFSIGKHARAGALVAAADVDGDGTAEIITALRAQGGTEVSTWKINGASAGLLGSFTAASAGDDGGQLAIAAGDLNGDGTAEIIVASGGGGDSGMLNISAYNYQGNVLKSFQTDSRGQISLAAGDLNLDGNAEIVVGDGRQPGRIRVYNGDGSFAGTAFNSYGNSGATITLGQFE